MKAEKQVRLFKKIENVLSVVLPIILSAITSVVIVRLLG